MNHYLVQSINDDSALILMNNKSVLTDRRLLPSTVKQGDEIEIFTHIQNTLPMMIPGTYTSALIILSHDKKEAFAHRNQERFQICMSVVPNNIVEESSGIMRTCKMKQQYSKQIYDILMRETEFDRNIFVWIVVEEISLETIASRLSMHPFKIKPAYYNCVHHLKMQGFDIEWKNYTVHLLGACCLVISQFIEATYSADPTLRILLVMNLKHKWYRLLRKILLKP